MPNDIGDGPFDSASSGRQAGYLLSRLGQGGDSDWWLTTATDTVQVITPDDTNPGLDIQLNDGEVSLRFNPDGELLISGATARVNVPLISSSYFETSDENDGTLDIQAVVVLMTELPTADPTEEGQLWNDTGTLKISAG